MESIKRLIFLLRPGDGPYAHPQSRAMLKLQSVSSGFTGQLTVTGLPGGRYMLYLFLNDGAAIFAGDVSGSGPLKTLPGIRLNSIWGAAIIHSATLAFCLKSTGVDWADVSARFKLIHAPRPVAPPVILEPEFPVPDIIDEYPEFDIPDETVEEPIEEPADETYISQPEPEPFFTPHALSDMDDIPVDDNVCESCPHVTREERINPFPSVFPNSEWSKISYPGPVGWWHYITGRIYSGQNIVAKAVGVPGEYGMTPPVWLEGFGTYLRAVTPDAHGYWLMFQDAETGEILDMALSPRDA